jgi:hypothetical protein
MDTISGAKTPTSLNSSIECQLFSDMSSSDSSSELDNSPRNIVNNIHIKQDKKMFTNNMITSEDLKKHVKLKHIKNKLGKQYESGNVVLYITEKDLYNLNSKLGKEQNSLYLKIREGAYEYRDSKNNTPRLHRSVSPRSPKLESPGRDTPSRPHRSVSPRSQKLESPGRDTYSRTNRSVSPKPQKPESPGRNNNLDTILNSHSNSSKKLRHGSSAPSSSRRESPQRNEDEQKMYNSSPSIIKTTISNNIIALSTIEPIIKNIVINDMQISINYNPTCIKYQIYKIRNKKRKTECFGTHDNNLDANKLTFHNYKFTDFEYNNHKYEICAPIQFTNFVMPIYILINDEMAYPIEIIIDDLQEIINNLYKI